MEEVLAVYRMHPKVQEHNVMDQWKVNTDMIDGDPPYMLFQGNDVKWYSGFYENGQAVEHILVVCNNFADERGFDYAYRMIFVDDSYGDSYELMDFLQDTLYPVRRINCDL